MPKIRFTKDFLLRSLPEPILYKAGSVHEGDTGFCERFIRRNVAESVPEDPKADVAENIKRGRKSSGLTDTSSVG